MKKWVSVLLVFSIVMAARGANFADYTYPDIFEGGAQIFWKHEQIKTFPNGEIISVDKGYSGPGGEILFYYNMSFIKFKEAIGGLTIEEINGKFDSGYVKLDGGIFETENVSIPLPVLGEMNYFENQIQEHGNVSTTSNSIVHRSLKDGVYTEDEEIDLGNVTWYRRTQYEAYTGILVLWEQISAYSTYNETDRQILLNDTLPEITTSSSSNVNGVDSFWTFGIFVLAILTRKKR